LIASGRAIAPPSSAGITKRLAPPPSRHAMRERALSISKLSSNAGSATRRRDAARLSIGKQMTDTLKAANLARWQRMEILPAFIPILATVAHRLIDPAAKARYQSVETATKVPWFVIAVIHQRESSQSWKANLAQGDPWNAKSIHVPSGRGPFSSWATAAIDALVRCPPRIALQTDWSASGALTELEAYNGLGYAHHGIPSPYIWASTDQYHRGKYIADGHFDPDAIDHQLGCAALLKSMMTLDASIAWKEELTS
jgi:lysozyme family protein